MIHYKKMGYLNEDFRIFHLTDTQQREFEFHYHDFNKILIFIKGNVTYSIEGRNYQLSPYDIVLVNAGEIHKPDIMDNGEYERIIIYVSKQYLTRYQTDTYNLSACFDKARIEKSNVIRSDHANRNMLISVCKKMEHTFYDTDFAHELYQDLTFLEFMICLNRAVIHDNADYLDTSVHNEKIQQVISYIIQCIKDGVPLTIDLIAESFYLSRYYLMHLFKESTGVSINSYINTKRLILAREYILSGENITETCYRCGFHNYSTFSRAFKKMYGIAPRELL